MVAMGAQQRCARARLSMKSFLFRDAEQACWGVCRGAALPQMSGLGLVIVAMQQPRCCIAA
jgi:hypothetical protein